jgi:serine/threonine-protein kinase
MRARALLGIVCVVAACGGDDASSANADGGSGGGPNDATTGDGGAGDGSAGDSGTTPDGSTGDGGSCTSLTDFPSSSIMYQDIANAAVDSKWATISQALAAGWGGPFQLDPSFTVNYADCNVARRTFTQDPGALPDCDTAPTPVPPGGKTEGNPNYFCAHTGDDCHLLVFQGSRSYEMYQGSITGGQATGGTFTGTCLVVWDLTRDYWQNATPFSRGDGCNGADAADLPISVLLLKKTEIMAHSIKHAMRFTIDNSKIDGTYYVHPTTHLGGSGTAMATLPYGARLRLKSTFDLNTLATPEAKAIAVALQHYGMFLADGGGFYVSGTTDITDVIDTHALRTLLPTDFEMVEGGTRYNFHQQNCTRTPITN